MVNSVSDGSRKTRHLLHIFPSFGIGGAQVRFAQLAAAHGGRYRHSIVALDRNFDMVSQVPSAVALECLKDVQFDKGAGLRNLPLFRSTLARIHPDLLITYNWGAMEWCLANRCRPLAPHLHIEDGFGREERDHQLLRRVIARRIALSGRHTRVVVPSHLLERIALEKWRLARASIQYVPNGVDCERFDIGSRPASGTMNSPIVIGTVATLRPEKRIDRLIEVFGAVVDARPTLRLELLIVGDGSEREKLEAVANATAYGSRIRFSGATPTPECQYRGIDIFALSVYPLMDVFAISSDTEQMPLSILEAMASGLPIASLDVGDVMDMVAAENRPFVVPRDGETQFRDSLLTLVDKPELRHALGRANRKAATDRFSQQAMIARYAELFG